MINYYIFVLSYWSQGEEKTSSPGAPKHYIFVNSVVKKYNEFHKKYNPA